MSKKAYYFEVGIENFDEKKNKSSIYINSSLSLILSTNCPYRMSLGPSPFFPPDTTGFIVFIL